MVAFNVLENQLFLSKEDKKLDSKNKIDNFLRKVQVRALRITMIHIRDLEESKDIVQDAMISLATKYANRPSIELPPLFYRILFNKIKDWHRKNTIRRKVISFFNFSGDDGDEIDMIESFGNESLSPVKVKQSEELATIIQDGLEKLPDRQKEAFILRNFEGMSVKDTSIAMRCSEGSVKTHYFRAMKKLKSILDEYEEE
tara:strand:- start:27780 stop:28379 length:600 start_codon:yes stop_codon:yes gene_type:complete